MRSCSVSFLLLLTLLLSGCSYGQRFIFNPSQSIVNDPSARQLSFQELWIPSEDGSLLHAWFVPAREGAPVVLFFHGNAANITYRVDLLHYFHQLNLAVLIFDYRGFGQSQGQTRYEKHLYEDGRAAYRALQEMGYRADQMIFFGRSMGASPALKLALEYPPAGLALEAPFTSLRDIARHITPWTYRLVGWWSIGDMFDNRAMISRNRVPLLLLHGDRDRIVPPWMSDELFQIARSPKWHYRFAEAGHSDAFLAGGDRYQKAWRFFLSQLPLSDRETASHKASPHP